MVKIISNPFGVENMRDGATRTHVLARSGLSCPFTPARTSSFSSATSRFALDFRSRRVLYIFSLRYFSIEARLVGSLISGVQSLMLEPRSFRETRSDPGRPCTTGTTKGCWVICYLFKFYNFFRQFFSTSMLAGYFLKLVHSTPTPLPR